MKPPEVGGLRDIPVGRRGENKTKKIDVESQVKKSLF